MKIAAVVIGLCLAGCASQPPGQFDADALIKQGQQNVKRQCELDLWKRGVVNVQGMHWVDYCSCKAGIGTEMTCRKSL